MHQGQRTTLRLCYNILARRLLSLAVLKYLAQMVLWTLILCIFLRKFHLSKIELYVQRKAGARCPPHLERTQHQEINEEIYIAQFELLPLLLL